ncbi:MAG: mobile mystery protein B [Candidatus Aceula meridiana]|nr:mobile mystery protein B [Candidatus Aceula meridiana]
MSKSKIYPQETPLDPDEENGLLIAHITTRKELNYWEQSNIAQAMQWLAKKQQKNSLTVIFIRKLHKKMFGMVWAWAGEFRKSDKNIGVPARLVASELQKLCDDAEFWVRNKTFSSDEIAARFHHRLTWIHPFPNGNGRHARLMTDLFLKTIFNAPCFTWGSVNLIQQDSARKRYVSALQSADAGDFRPLLDFVRT